MTTPVPEGKILIQFDGMCILCSRTVKFLLKADRKDKFLFQTLQQAGQANSPETVVVIDSDRSYLYFDAVLKIAYELGGFYKLMAVCRLIPSKWRKSIYLWVARNRFRWFGKRVYCYFPTDKERKKFI
jgi:predicted DCC family thiol-disulfide oxidoreductase YuxK